MKNSSTRRLSWLLIGWLSLFFGCSACASAEWYFRGTPGGWIPEAMEYVGGSEYQTCQEFSAGDAAGGPRFKIDRFADW